MKLRLTIRWRRLVVCLWSATCNATDRACIRAYDRLVDAETRP